MFTLNMLLFFGSPCTTLQGYSCSKQQLQLHKYKLEKTHMALTHLIRTTIYFQLLELKDEDMDKIDVLIPDRHLLGLMKPRMTAADIPTVLQVIYLREELGPWHPQLSQFLEGMYKYA